MQFVTFLNNNAGAFQVIFAALVTLATIVYAVLTWKLVGETRHMRKAQTNAKITIGVQIHEDTLHFLNLVVRNVGMGPAYDIRFSVTTVQGDTQLATHLSSFGFISRGIDYLSPNQTLQSFFTSMLESADAKFETVIRVEIRYRTGADEVVADEYLLDMSAFKNISTLGEPHLYTIAKSLKEIQKDIGHIVSGFKKINVITQDIADYRKVQQEAIERIKTKSNATMNIKQDGGDSQETTKEN